MWPAPPPTLNGRRWGALCGIALALSWSPIALVLLRFPDLGSPLRVESFWHTHGSLMQAVIFSVSVGFLFLMGFVGALVEHLLDKRASPMLIWTAFGSVVMFMTALNVAVGMDIAAGLLRSTTDDGTYVLHTAGFLLAAPAAPAGLAFFAAIAVITFAEKAFPRALGWLAVLGVITNAGAIFGIFALTGPLNSGNGLVGGIAAPLGAYVLWIVAVSGWWLRSPNAHSPQRSAAELLRS